MIHSLRGGRFDRFEVFTAPTSGTCYLGLLLAIWERWRQDYGPSGRDPHVIIRGVTLQKLLHLQSSIVLALYIYICKWHTSAWRGLVYKSFNMGSKRKKKLKNEDFQKKKLKVRLRNPFLLRAQLLTRVFNTLHRHEGCAYLESRLVSRVLVLPIC